MDDAIEELKELKKRNQQAKADGKRSADDADTIDALLSAQIQITEMRHRITVKEDKMTVITAPEEINKECNIKVFLAGGITNCHEWQDKVISELQEVDNITLINPRRKDFPINDPSASYKQIEWEFKMLEQADIFTMYFANSSSTQPICMYELGRNIVRMQNRFPLDWSERIIVTVEKGYVRENDVFIQTELATGLNNLVQYGDELLHANRIINAL